MNKNKSFFVKALSNIGPLVIMLNIAIGASHAFASDPYSFLFPNNNQVTPADNNVYPDVHLDVSILSSPALTVDDSLSAVSDDPSSALSMNYASNTPWYDPNQLGNPQLSLENTGLPFDPSEHIFNPSYFRVPDADAINNVHPSNGFQPPNYFGTGPGNNDQFSNLQNNNTPAPSGATLPRLNLFVNPDSYNLSSGGGFCSYLTDLYKVIVKMNKNISYRQV